MKERIILHCDLNNFFASVSLLFNPTLKNMPVAVCGDKENRHGIVLAKNEIAKSFGVKTAEAIFEAKAKCPQLVTLPPIYEKYEEYSLKARKIYERYTDMIEPFGIDECWLDVTGSTVIFGNGEEIANKIRNEIKQELGITISVGVSFNKVFAKLGSDMKKPDGVTLITRENYKRKVWSLPVSDLLFVGRKTCEKLKSTGIYSIGDIAQCDTATLERLLGKNGTELKKFALGEDNSPVLTPTKNDKPKSIGKSITCGKDFENNDDVWKAMLSFSQYICDILHQKELYAGGVQVHIRTSSLAVKEFSHTFLDSTNSTLSFAKRGFELFCKNYTFGEPLRSVGLRAINLKDSKTAVQQDIFGGEINEAYLEEIEDSIYAVRKKFGKSSIKRATNVISNKTLN
ncbi:MAG: DNA polymerase IV [Clostridia bacterium]|nr:DNA polymerase IV [Clostridia bacterium]